MCRWPSLTNINLNEGVSQRIILIAAKFRNVFDRDQWRKMIDFMTDAMFRLERAIKEPLKQAVEQVKNDSSE